MIPTGLIVALIIGCFFAGWAARAAQANESRRVPSGQVDLYDWAREPDL